MILGGLANSFVYAFTCSAFAVYPVFILAILAVIPVVFVLLIWFLSQISFARFFTLTVILVISYLFIGLPLYSYFFHLLWDMRYPGQAISGEGFAEILFTLLYIAMSIVAWIVAFVLTIYARWKSKKERKLT